MRDSNGVLRETTAPGVGKASEADISTFAFEAGAVGVWEWDTRTNAVTLRHNVMDLPLMSHNGPVPLALILDSIDLVDRMGVRRALELSRATDEPINVEFRVASTRKDPRWLVFRGRRLGAPREDFIAGVLIDVSDQRHTSQRRMLQHDALVALAKHPDAADGLVNTAFEAITRTAATILNVARSGVWLFNFDHSELVCEALFERDGIGNVKISRGMVLNAADYPRYFRAAEAARILPAADAREDPRTSEYKEGYLMPLGIDSMLDAPIRREGRVVGVICNESVNQRRLWTPDEQEFAAALGDLAGTVMVNADRRIYQAALSSSYERLSSRSESMSDIFWRAFVSPPVSVSQPAAAQVTQIVERARLVEVRFPRVLDDAHVDRFKGVRASEMLDESLLRSSLLSWIEAKYLVSDTELPMRLSPDHTDVVWLSASYFGVIENGFLKEIWGTQRRIDERKRTEASLIHRASHDALTGLPNRESFLAVFRDHIRSATASSSCAIFMVDLDHFKEVNDTLGHAAGDTLLHAIAPRVRSIIADYPGASIARVGSDEFAMVLPGVTEQQAALLAPALVAALAQPFPIRALSLEIGCSLGWAISPQQGTDPEELLRRADVAMYMAKQDRTGHRQYEKGSDRHTHRRLTLMTQIGAAIANRELFIEAQPIVQLADNRLLGFEALVRWQHPTFGLVSPGEFIRLAELTQAMGPLTQFVLAESLKLGKRLNADLTGLSMSINISPRVFKDFDVEGFLGQIRAAGMSPHLITLEVTETAAITDSQPALTALKALRAAGVKLAIDDFGTGYSSLSLLRALEFDAIKIDPGFVSGMLENERDRQIVRATIELAKSLGIRIVAEGVEDRRLFTTLIEAGCHAVQGYDIARPMRDHVLAQWVEEWSTHSPVGMGISSVK
jgi:diguanylate cyclase (GGDEF)-like protein